MPDDDETVNEDWILRMLNLFSLMNVIAVGGPYSWPCFEITPPMGLHDFMHLNRMVRYWCAFCWEWLLVRRYVTYGYC